jgi:hypothetical protein
MKKKRGEMSLQQKIDRNGKFSKFNGYINLNKRGYLMMYQSD